MRGTQCDIQNSNQQRGFTLLEILIAMTLGLFMLGGLVVVVTSNRSSSTDQNKLSQLQDGERMAMTMMTDVIQSAGYFPDPTINNSTGVFTVSAPFTVAGQSMVGTYNAASPGDTITVRYMTADSDTILNCSGVPNGSGANVTYTSTFSVVGGQLICTMNDTVNTTAYTLVNGVTNLSVLYGVNTLGTGNNVDTYLNATQVTATNNWNNVLSVNVALTFTNPLYVAGQTVQQQTLTIQRVIGNMNKAGPVL
jgi:type IV pilus assembly protein PilW